MQTPDARARLTRLLIDRLAFQEAILHWDMGAFDALLQSGADPLAPIACVHITPPTPAFHDSLLYCAVNACNPEATRALLDLGAPVDFIGESNRTALSGWADQNVGYYEPEDVQRWRMVGLMLLEAGADPGKCGQGEQAPLPAYHQALAGNREAVELIEPFLRKRELDGATPRVLPAKQPSPRL